MRFVFDIDGVIMTIVESNNYLDAKPIDKTVRIINKLYNLGHEIILFTARGNKTGIDWEDVTVKQLKDCGLLYHELRFGKPYADYYVDDKFITLEVIEKQIIKMGN